MISLRMRGAWFVHIAGLAALLLVLAGCRHKAQLSDLTEEFTYTVLSFSPSAATAAGLHEYKDQRLDGQLDDMGLAAMDRQTRFYRDFSQRLQQFDPDKLNPQDRADLSNLQDRVGLALLELNQVRSYLHDPLRYVEILGNAVYTPYILDYAPKVERFRHIASRLRQVPLFLDQAAANLVSTPAVWAKAAIESHRGIIDLVDGELRAAAPPEVRQDYSDAAGIALPAMRKFQQYLTDKLQYLDNADWRLGSDLYPRKFHYVLESGGLPQDLLVSAEREFGAVRAHMFELALPLHRSLFPAHKDHRELAEFDRQQLVIGEVLASLASRHSTPQSFLDDIRRDLEESRAFVQRKHLLTPVGAGNLQVRPTPEFRRTVDAAARLQPSPALEPQLSAFYWIAPITPDMPKELAESKLREYNSYRLKLLTLGMTIPGAYSQTQAANTVQPPARRLLRSVFGAHAYTQGWAQYSTQTMVAEGFPGNSPEMALAFGKEQLRTLSQAVLDVRLHMLHLTDEEALHTLRIVAFQEPEEAAAELQRAKLTSCELPGYFVGTANWIKVRGQYQSAHSGSQADFNDQALKQGAVPMSSLAALLTR
jgi:uncharacterized protein (DUF885 family)